MNRCEAFASRGTGVGVCDRPLDGQGACDRRREHIDDRRGNGVRQ